MAMLTFVNTWYKYGHWKIVLDYWSIFPKVDDAKEFYMITKTHFSIHI